MRGRIVAVPRVLDVAVGLQVGRAALGTKESLPISYGV